MGQPGEREADGGQDQPHTGTAVLYCLCCIPCGTYIDTVWESGVAPLHVVDSGVTFRGACGLSYCDLDALDPQSGIEAVKVNL